MSDFAIQVENLTKVYPGRRGGGGHGIRAVDDLSFAVRPGMIFGLLGPNGAGKTTTLKILTTLVRPTSGDARVLGFDVVRNALDVRRRIVVVIQEHAVELFLSVKENLITFARFHGLSGPDVRLRADRVIEMFGLTEDVGRKVQDLSGGFRRRVQVAKVFMVDTPIVFLDEFSTGMDPILKRAVMDLLRQAAAGGRTIVLTTQILSEAEDLCDDILIIDKGRQVARGDLNALKLLTERVYEVSLTFDRLPADLDAALAGYTPLRKEVHHNTLHLALQDDETRVLALVTALSTRGTVLRIEINGASLEDIFIELTRPGVERGGTAVRALAAVIAREGKIRATNLTFIFWDLFYPLAYLLVFGVGINASLGFTTSDLGVGYSAFFLAGVLAMASFGIASNTSWSFFLDRDNGIFYEMLTYPLSRSQYLLGKVLFNVFVAIGQATITILLAALLLDVPLRVSGWPLALAAVIVGTAGWFFFYAIFALRIRRNDAFNTVTSIFYFVFLFASSMFYPLDPLPPAFRAVAYANPITWHTDVVRYATIGIGDPSRVALEAAAFVVFTAAAFAVAAYSLQHQD